MSFVPLLDDERYKHYGATIGELLQFNKGELPKEFIEKLCKSFLDMEAYPKYFSPMPEQKDYNKVTQWYDALDDWLDSFSHGEKEMMCLAMGLKAAKAASGILFIDNFGDGIHIVSQEEITKAIPSMAEDIDIVYTTHHLCMLQKDHDHYADLWSLQHKEK
jgi:ABC-type Mn2+/Zn2+ transport system ATPase subunit